MKSLTTNLLEEIPEPTSPPFNRYFLRHIHLTKSHFQPNFTCDHCQQTFANSSLYSLAWHASELPYYHVYCTNCFKQMPGGIKQWKKLTQIMPTKKIIKTKSEKKQPKENKISAEEKYWEEVDQLAQVKIYQLFTKNIPFQNIPLITEPWRFEERQQKLTGLFLRRDVDYRTLLAEVENQSSSATSEQEYLAEEITLWYCRMVIKALLNDCSELSGYDPSLFENLTHQ